MNSPQPCQGSGVSSMLIGRSSVGKRLCVASSALVEHASQSANSNRHLPRPYATKPQDEALNSRFLQIARGERPQPKLFERCTLRDDSIFVSIPHCSYHMHPRFGPQKLHFISKLFLHAFDKSGSALAVLQAHSPDVSGKVAFANKVV